jgi:DNA modification methylase
MVVRSIVNKATILLGDVQERLGDIDDNSVRCCVTSPPYWGLRDYGHDGQIGLEQTPEDYVAKMVQVFREVRRVLTDDGTLWLNIGDSYAAQRGGTTPPAETLAGGANGWMADGSRVNRDRHEGYNPSSNASAIGLKHKDLVGIPWRLAFALQADGWWLRQDIIWHKPNPMPESVTDRCTKAHEYVFLLSKSSRYYYDADAVAEPAIHAGHIVKAYKTGKNISGEPMRDTATGGHDVEVGKTRNRRSVWSINTKPFRGAHFAVMPEALAEPCILAGSELGDLILDPFTGAGTTAVVALKHGRNFVGCELNPEYMKIAEQRITQHSPLFNEVETR